MIPRALAVLLIAGVVGLVAGSAARAALWTSDGMQGNCKVYVPPFKTHPETGAVLSTGSVSIDVKNCQQVPTLPTDCLHFAIITPAIGGSASGYVAFGVRDAAGKDEAFFGLWGPSPGWFHSPQMPLETPGMNRLWFVNASAYPQTIRVLWRGLPAPCTGAH